MKLDFAAGGYVVDWVEHQAQDDSAAAALKFYQEEVILLRSVLDYAANHIGSTRRRGVFIAAFVAGDEWAELDFENWMKSPAPGGSRQLKE